MPIAVPPRALGRYQCRAKAAKGVEHEIASAREALDYEPRQFLWKAEEGRSLEGDVVNDAAVHGIADGHVVLSTGEGASASVGLWVPWRTPQTAADRVVAA